MRDAQGRAGVTGEVDNRFWNRYGTAFMLSAISAAVRGATASGVSDAARDRNDAITDEAGKELAERFGEITASVLQETVALRPVISIPQGTRVQIRPARDWYIRKNFIGGATRHDKDRKVGAGLEAARPSASCMCNKSGNRGNRRGKGPGGRHRLGSGRRHHHHRPQ